VASGAEQFCQNLLQNQQLDLYLKPAFGRLIAALACEFCAKTHARVEETARVLLEFRNAENCLRRDSRLAAGTSNFEIAHWTADTLELISLLVGLPMNGKSSVSF
jgi:hypothetical protein